LIYSFLNNKYQDLGGKYFMAEEKKGKIEKGAEKTGEVVGKGIKTGWGAIKGFGKGVKDAATKKDEEKKE